MNLDDEFRQKYGALLARNNAAQDQDTQARLAAPEHQAFVRTMAGDNPVVGLATALGSLPYALGKQMYFDPSWRGAIDSALPDAVAEPMWKFLQKQVGRSRSQNADPWGQIASAWKGFGQGLGDFIGE